MSNHIKDATASSSLDCPVVEGRCQVQHVPARAAEVGGIPIHRVLPSRQRRLVGAWCFLDHAGPAVFKGDSRGMQVGPHPHIGLQTFTWMIAGEVLHRDSLGSEQVIRPGQVNLMTAGRGISHTEQSLPDDPQLHAAQLWIALPAGARVLLIGGEPLGEEVLIWWNFVGHSKAEIAEAQREWEAGGERFGRVAGFRFEERLMPPPLPWKG
ncbi:pirin family protein [Halomonas mongoliensis]|uniref:pirin family protein n=1 Tax=Halomonas mongoliensis TaxID=321265 RepID=UPI00403A94B3